jgi:DNA polymerase (family 10)
MNNRQVAKYFSDIADLLSIKGESRFRILAYQRAAETIADLGRDIEEVWKAGELEDVPGIGEAIAAKISELLDEGKMAYYEKLTAEIPVGLIEVLNVNHVGPKKAALFWQELGVTTVDQLAEAAEADRLSTLPGMGAKSQEKILEAIAALRRHQTGRILLGEAVPKAEAILASLRQLPSVAEAEAAGSLRRMRETVGDLDLLAASDEPETVMDNFLEMLPVDHVVGRGPTKTSVVLDDGLRVQLWVHPVERFGSALQYATGSKEHSVKLRELSLKQGLSLSEHGFKVEESDELIACRTEAEVYQKLGLPWIPPELREDRGEVEAAQNEALPKLVERKHLRADLHSHSDWSDGRATLKEMVDGAIAAGHDYLVITDHSQSLGVANGLTPERLRKQRKEIDKLQKKVGDKIRLFQGAEVEILADGRLDYEDNVMAELDLVIASLHTSLGQPRNKIQQRLLNAIRNPHVDLIGHPSGRLIGRRDPADLDFETIFKEAAEHGTVLEINSSPERLDLKDTHARLAVELGCTLAINTDAHHPDHFELLTYGVATARRGWIGPGNVLTTRTLAKFEKWLASRGP